MCYAWEKILYDRLSISFSIQKKSKKKKIAYLPYLAFSDMLPEPHICFYLALTCIMLYPILY